MLRLISHELVFKNSTVRFCILLYTHRTKGAILAPEKEPLLRN